MKRDIETDSPDYDSYEGFEEIKLSKWVKLSRYIETDKFAILVLAALFAYCKPTLLLSMLIIVFIFILGISGLVLRRINHGKTKKRRTEE